MERCVDRIRCERVAQFLQGSAKRKGSPISDARIFCRPTLGATSGRLGISPQPLRGRAAAKKLTTEALTKTEELIQDLKKTLNEIKIDQHDIGFEPSSALKKLATPLEEISAAIRKVQETEINLISSDPVRDRLDAIFLNKIGPAPKSQAELEQLTHDVEKRYQSKIPPGWKDAETKKDQSFVSDHLHYKNAHGDLIFWRQLMVHVKTENIKNVILVTNENKEDWWWKESGEIVGPLSELMREIRREACVELFWMYKTDLFLKTSQEYTSEKFKVTPEAVAEVREVIERENSETRAYEDYHSSYMDADDADAKLIQKINNRTSWHKSVEKNYRVHNRNKKLARDIYLKRLHEGNYEGVDNPQEIDFSVDLTIGNKVEKWIIENRGIVVERNGFGDYRVISDGVVLRYRFELIYSIEEIFDLNEYIRSEFIRSAEKQKIPTSRFIFGISSENFRHFDLEQLSAHLNSLTSTFGLEEIVVTIVTNRGLEPLWTILSSDQ